MGVDTSSKLAEPFEASPLQNDRTLSLHRVARGGVAEVLMDTEPPSALPRNAEPTSE